MVLPLSFASCVTSSPQKEPAFLYLHACSFCSACVEGATSCQPAFPTDTPIYLEMGKHNKLRVDKLWKTGAVLLKSVSTCASGFSRINLVYRSKYTFKLIQNNFFAYKQVINSHLNILKSQYLLVRAKLLLAITCNLVIKN